MSYLVDTNVLSELRRKKPNANVVAWLQQRPANSLFLSVLTLGEIRKGVDGVAAAAKRLQLQDWLEVDLPAFFTGRILPIDATVATRWGQLLASTPRPLPAIDSLLAATALVHNLILVTRNESDFADLPLQVINPWLVE